MSGFTELSPWLGGSMEPRRVKEMNVKIYTTSWCPYCQKTRKLFVEKEVEFTEVDIEQEGISRDDLQEITGGRTVPQIILDEEAIGGFDKLMSLVKSRRISFD